jgi:MscS family membrane protein
MSRVLGRLASLILFVIFLATLFALTQAEFNDTTHEKPYLLSLPDLSSPRATLQTLIENGDIAGRAIMATGVPWEPTPPILRMMATVDVSDMSESRRELQAALAAGRLKFIVDHIELPPMSEIPDAAMVKDQKISEWRVPNTGIVIGRATTGAHKGDFQFTPQTVALSNSLYDALNDIPLKAGQPPHYIKYLFETV